MTEIHISIINTITLLVYNKTDVIQYTGNTILQILYTYIFIYIIFRYVLSTIPQCFENVIKYIYR